VIAVAPNGRWVTFRRDGASWAAAAPG
jgi:hypothetical protein